MKQALYVLFVATFLVSACSDVKTESGANYPHSRGGEVIYTNKEEPGVLGEDGITLFGTNSKKEKSDGASLPINKYLWRATLETLSFMPLQSADPFGGTVITDWYQPDSAKDERLKTQIFIQSAELKASSIRAQVFREVKDASNNWIKAETAKDTNRKMEDAILAKARELRIAETR